MPQAVSKGGITDRLTRNPCSFKRFYYFIWFWPRWVFAVRAVLQLR